MSTNSDRWLLPRQQTEYPARALVPEATLHGRREATFLVLAAMFFVTSTVMLVLGAGRAIDLSTLIESIVPNVHVPVAMTLPLGIMPFAASIVASALVCELFGRRRAGALIVVGLVASVGLVGLMRLADMIDGGAAFGTAIGLAACFVVAHAVNFLGFALMRDRARGRHLFLRLNAVALLAYAAGFVVFALVMRSGYVSEPTAEHAIPTGAAVWSALCTFVLAIPAVVAARALAIALRVGFDQFGFEAPDDEPADDVDEPAWARPRPAFAEGSVARRLPAAEVVDDEPDAQLPRRARAMSIPPYSSAEMRFFSEGDEA